LLQFDDMQAAEVFRQYLHVVGGSAAPAVDRLVIVAHRGEGAAHTADGADHAVLADIGVLVFVDQQVAQLVAPFFEDFRVFLEEFHRQADQVVEIGRLVGVQRILVSPVGARRTLLQFVLGGVPGGIGADQGVLPQRNALLGGA